MTRKCAASSRPGSTSNSGLPKAESSPQASGLDPDPPLLPGEGSLFQDRRCMPAAGDEAPEVRIRNAVDGHLNDDRVRQHIDHGENQHHNVVETVERTDAPAMRR